MSTSTSPVDPVWQRRFNSLNGRISALRTMIAANSNLDRYALFEKLVDCLQQFAEAQFRFFANGFQQGGTLQHSDEFPPDHVLAVTLQQISYDLEAIQWAVEQRLNGDQDTNDALASGDRLASKALALGQANFSNLGQVAVVTYFQKFAEIRVIPYASVALIGLPITCIPDQNGDRAARDFLATPHEMGHYVYWHAKIDTDKGTRPLYQYLIDQAAARDVEVAGEWLEEIFADVYGCLVAGPVIAQSFQDLQMWVRQKNFYQDDGEHPTPYIRPDIYTKVLHKKLNPNWAVAVHVRWQALRAKRKKNAALLTHKVNGQQKQPADFITMLDSHDHPLLYPGADKPVDIMINLVLETLGTVITGNWWQQYAPLTESPTDTTDLYEAFHNHVENALTLPPPSDQAICLPPNGEPPLQEQWHSDTWSPPLDTVPEQPGWLNVFRAGGWATKGPQTNPVGG